MPDTSPGVEEDGVPAVHDPHLAEDLSTETTLLADRYRLEECVGSGALARVYRAVDVQLGRTVAVKVMHGGLGPLSGPERARNEMRLLASVSHPSLVKLLDGHVTSDGTSYLVMEFVSGETLADRLGRGPLSTAEARHLAVQLATALQVVHRARVVHRDVKPSNILLGDVTAPGRLPQVKLADFGVARLIDSDALTATGTVVGTAAYLAPEQVRGEAAGPPADVYALGLLLLEALTGKRAYAHSTGIASVMERLIDPPVVPESVGRDWALLLTRMTDVRPEHRPSAEEASRIAADIADRPVSAPGTETAPFIPVVATCAVDARAIPPAVPTATRAEHVTRRGTRRAASRRRVRSRRAVAGGSAVAAAAVLTALILGSHAPAASIEPVTQDHGLTGLPATTSVPAQETDQQPATPVTPTAPSIETAGDGSPAAVDTERGVPNANDKASRDLAKEQRMGAREAQKSDRQSERQGSGARGAKQDR